MKKPTTLLVSCVVIGRTPYEVARDRLMLEDPEEANGFFALLQHSIKKTLGSTDDAALKAELERVSLIAVSDSNELGD